MDFYSPAILDVGPLLLKFFLHLAPDAQLVFSELLEFLSCLRFKQVESISSLNYCGFRHQVFQLSEVAEGSVAFPDFLDVDSCHLRAAWAFEHGLRPLYYFQELLFVRHAIYKFSLCVLLEVHFCVKL